MRLRELAFPTVRFEEPVFGQAAELAATGSLDLASGALDTAIEVTRLDAPGGQLALKAAFSNSTRQLDLDLGAAGAARAAWSPPCSRSRARPPSTSACRAPGRSTRST